MNVIRSNLFGYHIFSFAMGVAYFYGSIYGFNILGGVINPIFLHIQPNTESIVIPVAINIGVAFIGSSVPALLFTTAAHFILSPNTKLFLFASSLSYAIFSTWNILGNYYSNNINIDSSYIYALSGKALGGFIVLWLVCIIYLRVKPNKQINLMAQKDAPQVS